MVAAAWERSAAISKAKCLVTMRWLSSVRVRSAVPPGASNDDGVPVAASTVRLEGVRTDVVAAPAPPSTLSVLVYSDDLNVRAAVLAALGTRPAPDLPELR